MRLFLVSCSRHAIFDECGLCRGRELGRSRRASTIFCLAFRTSFRGWYETEPAAHAVVKRSALCSAIASIHPHADGVVMTSQTDPENTIAHPTDPLRVITLR